ncbi:MAG: glycosyltransferase family 4 protein [Candidatus Pacebacteria bacterium]|nr:glycosyltransferase family 4 protein [Candidatus Paceibacterota bacterium]
MRILIVTPLVPPEPGGPSYYSVALKEALERAGETVDLIAFKEVRKYPTGIRHLIFLYKVLFRALTVDALIVLDTVSVALPAVIVGWVLGKKTLIRTGGDFVWEAYVERTGEKVLFRDFYTTARALSYKERMLVWLHRHVILPLASHITYNTELQRAVWRTAYGVSDNKTSVTENSYPVGTHRGKGGTVFVCAWRPTAFKNVDMLEQAVIRAQGTCGGVVVDYLRGVPREAVYARLQEARALIVPSLTEFGPNLAMEALSMGVPVLLTRECGVHHRLDGFVTWFDPLDAEDLAEKMCMFMDTTFYAREQEKVDGFSFVRSYDEVARDISTLLKTK